MKDTACARHACAQAAVPVKGMMRAPSHAGSRSRLRPWSDPDWHHLGSQYTSRRSVHPQRRALWAGGRSACACGRGAKMASEEGRWYTVIWALKERTGELATKPVGRLDGGVHWTGRSAVWKVGRAMCGGRHMEQADTTPVVVAARGPATCAATGAGGERQPGRDAHRRLAMRDLETRSLT